MRLLRRVIVSPVGVLSLGLTALFLVRLPLIWTHRAFADDTASYLMTYHWLMNLGHDPVGLKEAHFRPPLSGVLLVPFVWTLGELMALKMVGILTSVLIAIPGYYLARHWLRPWLAAAVAFFLTVDLIVVQYSSAWLPGIALGLTLWATRELLDILDGKGHIWRVVLATFLIVGFNQSAVPLWFAVAALLILTGRCKRRGLMAMLFGILASLPWAPFYLVDIPFGRPMIYANVPPVAVSLVPLYLLYAFPLAVLGVYALAISPRRAELYPMLAVAFFAIVMSSLGMADVAWNNVVRRAAYLMPPLLFILVAWLFQGRREGKRPYSVVLAVLGLALVVSLPVWNVMLQAPPNAKGFYLTPDRISVAQWVRDNTPKDTFIVAHPRSLAYWIGGIGDRNWEGSWDVPLKGREDEALALRCALGQESGCDPYRLKEAYGASLLAVDSESDGYTPAPATWLNPLFQDGTVTVYEWK